MRATFLYIAVADSTGPTTRTYPHEARSITVIGLTSGAKIRIRIKAIDFGRDGGSVTVRGGDGPAGPNPETYPGVVYYTSSDQTESAIPDDGDTVEWLATEVI